MQRSDWTRFKPGMTLAVAGLTAILVAACGGSAPPSAVAPSAEPGGSSSGNTSPIAGGRGRPVAIRITSDWDTFDPYARTNLAVTQIAPNFYDQLLAIGPEEELLPYLADTWEQDGKEVTFHIKDGVTCSDGAALAPSVVAQSLTRLFAESPNTLSLFGPGPYSAVGDDATGEVVVTLGASSPDVLYGFTGWDSSIICPAGLADPASLTTTPSGSGPYVIENAVLGEGITLALRPDWTWGPMDTTAATPGIPEKLEYKIVTNTTTAANLLLSGELDVANIAGPDLTRLQADPKFTQIVLKSLGADLLGFNHLDGYITTNKTLRQALSMAIDRDAYNQAATGGVAETATSDRSTIGACYDPTTAQLAPTGGPGGARALLNSAGYTEGPDGFLQKDGQPLSLVLTSSNAFNFGSGPEYIINQWIAAGINATLESTDLAAYNESVRGLTYTTGMFPFGQIGGGRPTAYRSVHQFYGPLPTEGGRNLLSIRDPEIDAEIDAAFQSTTEEESCAHWATVQQRALQESHLLPLVSLSVYIFTNGVSLIETPMGWSYRVAE